MIAILLTLFIGILAPFAQNDCPPGMVPVANCEPELYDGNNFETCFEYGSGHIAITGFNYTPDGEVWRVSFVVTSTPPVSAAFVKAGTSGDNLYIYDPPLYPNPTDEHFVEASDDHGISHVTWCILDNPTAVTLSNQSAEGVNQAITLLALGIATGFAVLGLLILAQGKGK